MPNKKHNSIGSVELEENQYNPSATWFFFLFLYILIDYGRLQDILPIGFLRPGMAIILILTWYLISTNTFKITSSKQTRLIIAFVLLTALYIPFARNNFFAFKTTESMLSFLPFIFSTIIVINSIYRLKKLIDFNIIIMVYISLFALTHGGIGSGSYFQDENDLSLYINTFLPFCFFLFLYEKKKKRFLYGVGMLVGIIAIVTSFSRGGFVGLACMLPIAWVFSPKKFISLGLICLLAPLIIIYGGKQYEKEIFSITETQEGTAKGRIESWKSGWEMFLDNPFGVGGNNFQARFPEYQTTYFQRGMWGRAAHSLWFTLLPELGIIGVFIYFSLLHYNLKDIFYLKNLKQWNSTNNDIHYLYYLSLAFLTSLVGYFASSSFLSVLYYPHYWYLTGFIVASSKIAHNLKDSSKS